MAIEESLLSNSQFLGRDGFRWWIGQVAPREAQADQTDDGKGWSNRYKVRIMGYHPFTDDVTDEDLPWAIALLPTTAGSGAANYATSTRLQQGDVVFGFFLDGDEGQIPAILGHFGHTSGIDQNSELEGKFKPGSAFTENTPINPKTEVNDEGIPDQTGEQNLNANPTNSSATKGKNVDQSGAGRPVVAPDTCTTNSVSRMAQAIEDLANRVEDLSLTGMKLEAEIDAVADQVESMANGFVGRMMDATYDFLEPQLQKGLDKVYEDTFGKVFSQMGNSPQSYAMAHASGVASQVSQVPAIKNAENALACVGNKVVEGLRGTVSDMLKDLLASGLGLAGCVAANFVSKFLGNMVNGISDGLKSPLSGLSDILSPGVDIAEFLRSSAFVLEDFSGFIDCGQTNKDKCPPVKKYEIAGGPMEKGADPFNYLSGQMQKSAKGGFGGLAGGITGLAGGLGDITEGIQGALGGVQNIVNAVSDPSSLVKGAVMSKFGNLVPPGITKTLGSAGRISGLIDELSGGGSCTGGKKNCGNPQVEIFGGGGFGAIGKVVLGKTIENSGLGGVAEGISKTASIIGVDIKVPGMNYKSPPAIRFADKCGQGYGAHGHAVLTPDGTIGAVVIDTTGEGYPVITDPDPNVGLTTVFVEDPGTGYTPDDTIDETIFTIEFPTGFPDTEVGIGTPTTTTDPDDPDYNPELIPDPYTKLVPTGERVQLQNLTDRPVFDLVVNPTTGGIEAVRVLNILKYSVPPVIKVISPTGSGAVLRPVFGEIPPEAQKGVITVIDCSG
tara:strand:- start:379 stop:2724 length:2346 start_codon:yes stop_codon:yes gene_type:complete